MSTHISYLPLWLSGVIAFLDLPARLQKFFVEVAMNPFLYNVNEPILTTIESLRRYPSWLRVKVSSCSLNLP